MGVTAEGLAVTLPLHPKLWLILTFRECNGVTAKVERGCGIYITRHDRPLYINATRQSADCRYSRYAVTPR